MIVSLLAIHIIKDFSGFRNLYIFDLQEEVSRFRNKSSNQLYIDEKEALRITNGENDTYKFEHSLLLMDNNNDLTDFYIRNCYFPDTLYFIVHEEKNETHKNRTSKNYLKNYIQIGSFISSFKKNKTVSIYEHFPVIIKPKIENDDFLKGCVLKSYLREYDTFIYQKDNRIIWLIGTEIKNNINIIYHIHAENPEDLPPSRVEHGFESKDFSIGSKYKMPSVGIYSVYERDIPAEYRIHSIKTGFYGKDLLIFAKPFSVSDMTIKE